MPYYCPKCGSKVTEDMGFCPNCGAPLKVTEAPAPAAPTVPPSPPPYRAEKAEKREKQEKGERPEKREKGEKHEKGEYGFLGPLIGGLVLIFIGISIYASLTTGIAAGTLWAIFFIIIGILIIAAAAYAVSMASRRHPQT